MTKTCRCLSSRLGLGFTLTALLGVALTAWAQSPAPASTVTTGNAARPESTFRFPTTGGPARSQALLLAIDDQTFSFRENITLRLTKPAVQADPVLSPGSSPDAPDNKAVHFFGSVLHDGAIFRMWYHGCHVVDPATNELSESPVCYAESTDGVNWTRPNLGQVEWRGNTNNNIVKLGTNPIAPSAGVSVIRDDEDPRAERRYKMIWSRYTPEGWMASTAVSADGVTWTSLPNDAFGKETVEFATLYKHDGLYILTGHILGRGEGDRPEGRQGYAIVSSDFEHWIAGAAPSFKTPEPVKGAGYGREDRTGLYTQVHIGVGAASYGNVAVGLWGMWHHREPRWGEMGINCDLGLVVSHDGIHFDEVVKNLPYITSEESPASPVPGRSYPTILCQGNGILNVGAETWIYHSRWRNGEFAKPTPTMTGRLHSASYWGEIALARIPRDRWGSLGLWGDKNTGSVWTAPVTLPANATLTLNASGLEGLRVTVLDEKFQALAGYEAGRAHAANNDALDASVSWTQRNLQELAGRTVRFRLDFARVEKISPELFALNLGTN